MQLRPLLVVTGTIHVDGGASTEILGESDSVKKDGVEQKSISQKRTITTDRRAANVITTNCLRQIRKAAILRTPFGTLFPLANKKTIKKMLDDMSKAVADFNKHSTTCELVNTFFLDKLEGDREAALSGWLSKRVDKPEIQEVLSQLVDSD